MTVKIEHIKGTGTNLSYPDSLPQLDLVLAVSVIYRHAQLFLREQSQKDGIDYVKLAEEKINQRN